MTYPQPNFTQQVVGQAQQVYRLFTALEGPGDIYESDQSALAFALGSESDIANVRVTYFDAQMATTLASSFVISPDRAWVPSINARPDQLYTAAKKKGRILFSVEDIYDPAYQPLGFNVANDRLDVQVPRLDIVGLTAAPQSLQSQRRDGSFLFNYYQDAALGTSWNVIPYYGRKAGYVDIQNYTGGAATVEIRGVNFTTRYPAGGVSENIESVLYGPTAIADNAHARQPITLPNQGYYDALAIGVTLGGAMTAGAPLSMRIITTDRP